MGKSSLGNSRKRNADRLTKLVGELRGFRKGRRYSHEIFLVLEENALHATRVICELNSLKLFEYIRYKYGQRIGVLAMSVCRKNGWVT